MHPAGGCKVQTDPFGLLKSLVAPSSSVEHQRLRGRAPQLPLRGRWLLRVMAASEVMIGVAMAKTFPA